MTSAMNAAGNHQKSAATTRRSGFRACNAILIGFALACMLAGCQQQRIEHHRRPAFFEKLTGDQPEEIVLDDGTIIRYHTLHKQGIRGRSGDDGSSPFQVRQQHEDGSITLHALLPEHVLANLQACLGNQEYQLIYDQLLSERTKVEMEGVGESFDTFAAFLSKNRHDLYATVTRMLAGIPSQETKFTKSGDGITRCELRPQVAAPYKFKRIDVIAEAGNLKLLMIHGG